mmetsp:Transcript_104148/g.299743  ORF Transcript_104148/g.299743 Transcript_104148/m.299743 type:complete len:290 (+) Transcript_104148:121-990(+)
MALAGAPSAPSRPRFLCGRKPACACALNCPLAQRLRGGGGVGDDRHEGGLERGPAHEEAVHVRLRDELLAVLRRHTAAILDAHLLRHLGGNLLLQEGADGRVRLLRLVRRSHLARADGPDGLVGDDDVVPILDLRDDGGELALVHLVCLPRLALLQHLADAQDDLDALLLADLDLLRRDLVGVAVLGAALGVADERPPDAEVGEVLRAPFPGEGTEACGRDILGGHGHAEGLDALLDHGDMQGGGADEDVDLVLVERRPLPSLDQLRGRLRRCWVALPVAADDRLAGHG